MITIHTVMLVTLGFLLAVLIGFAVVPAVQARAVRLTSARLRRSLPLTEQEIRADKDRLRAEYAIKIHKLETQVEAAKLSAARQFVDINRRDAWISALERESALLKSELDAAQNARSVLDQALSDRLPKLQMRLDETKELLVQRERDIAELTAEAERQSQALQEASQLNEQQKAELERLAAVTQGGGDLLGGSELDILRSKTREQAILIARFHALLANRAANRSEGRSDTGPPLPSPDRDGARQRVTRTEEDIEQLKRDVSEAAADADAKSARVHSSEMPSELTLLQERARTQDAKIQDQDAQIARLKAELGIYKRGGVDERSMSLKDSKLALKARFAALQAQSDSQTETIRKLRADLAATNERAARQAQKFVAEMRRLGVTGRPTAGPDAGEGALPAKERRNLADRIAGHSPDGKAAPVPPRPARPAGRSMDRPEEAAGPNGSGKVAEFLRALGDPAAVRSPAPPKPDTGAGGTYGVRDTPAPPQPSPKETVSQKPAAVENRPESNSQEADAPVQAPPKETVPLKPAEAEEGQDRSPQETPVRSQPEKPQQVPAKPAAEPTVGRLRLMDRIARVSKP
ncbi:MAG: hypothetical protein ACREC6_05175 [Hyphomicrobiaceae bacterium]